MRFGKRFLTGSAVAVALVTALPVIGQPAVPEAPAAEAPQPASPKSLLPEGFDTPAPAAPSGPLLEESPAPQADLVLPPLVTGAPQTVEQQDIFAAPSGRDITVLGPLSPAAGGYGPAIWTGSDGRFVAALARRVDAPIASRWAAIVLRRALLSESAAPAGINPGDWVAARAMLLLRIGEIDGAKRLVDAVPVDRYTPDLYRISAQVSLTAADIGGLCPIAATGRLLIRQPVWDLAHGMCAAIQGDDITAAQIFDALRDDDQRIDPFDVRLGERVATIAGGAGRATNIEWAEAPPLTVYRYGVATAAGVTVPAEKLAPLGPARFGWLVRSPGVAAETRLTMLRDATALGTMSVAELVSAVAALTPTDNAGGYPVDSRAGRLRAAFSGSTDARRRALAAIRSDTGQGGGSYGALLETALASARLPVSDAAATDAPDIIAALLAGGLADQAQRWWPVADRAGGAVRARAWALLAVGTGGVPVTADMFADWRSATDSDDRHAQLLLAALAGLDGLRGSDWDDLKAELLPRSANNWTRSLDQAAAAGRQGETALLAAVGLQGEWRDVPPLHLQHIIAGLARTGRTAEARLVAAEALTRA